MKKIWTIFILVVASSFAALIWVGTEIYQKQPPIPQKVVVKNTNSIIYTKADIQIGQNVWESIGGMEVGSIWGHGSYVAPDWTADWIHREAEFLLNYWAKKDYNNDFEKLDVEKQGALKARLVKEIKTNTYNKETESISISQDRLLAIKNNITYYSSIFSEGHEQYAIQKGALTNVEKLEQLNAFLFWTSWAASTNRPNKDYTYTSNWPHEPLINNTITADSQIWSGFSIILLLLFIGILAYYYIRNHEKGEAVTSPSKDPLVNMPLFQSQKAVLKYFFVVSLLIALQVVLGIITVHYTVEGQSFFGFELSKFLPYSISRTWHTQLAVFWIAITWLATGLFLAPMISGKEMKYQVFGINFLFIAALIIVLGSMLGEWLGVHQFLELSTNFFFGHQGYEYMDMGRFWQLFLAVGLILWMFMVGRHIVYGIKKKNDDKHLLTILLVAVIAIGMFFFSGLMYGENSSLPVINYWRWWLVHLWVEGFFEVFATVTIAYLFSRMKIISVKTAGKTSIASATIFLAGGIIGTLHHLYYSGTPVQAIALGATFSALEVVPLTLMGFEIRENWNLLKENEWIQRYKWPIFFFIAVAFWNMVGAGVFGFLINPPIALYYIQGLNTTSVHAHTALFGVYGMLGMGFIITCLRLYSKRLWNEKLIKNAFWLLNIGLVLMVVLSLLPLGIIQAYTSITKGYSYARDAELLYTPTVQTIKWLRVIGDVVFSVGIGYFCWFVIKETVNLIKNRS
ncbi:MULTISPECIES: nitric-oxide reductase large subunit [unclassified Tenacibaculum]|uniref:nitric-oxide reductase large subunit n=1 Tax=unclassified Tenacibaculum TaxID=2635139 RepID=UPI001F447AAE|nr:MULTISPECIES: nitric-oxide reductase large subunit [unclassified Tenacibaculum]MCF2876155.1 nitric-oxide reductase large subunit [Tenacibaculum sp. Cn5-1]MCF2936230.1 nitric-oxide reductase large subunit [Tenacibaculum sp. Cn5-34]MCG7511573.1 nitric-oxide reductase large subunit [Tenacibaculum sp. Cn5-46]